MHAVSNIFAAATKPAASSANPVVQRIAETITYSTEEVKGCASALDLALSQSTKNESVTFQLSSRKCVSLDTSEKPRLIALDIQWIRIDWGRL